MGAPKQKWTSEEEAALKAGIQRYGVGKWSTILKDPEFNVILRSRSNVDLKDKWRNLNCMASGMGSRHRASVAYKKSQLSVSKHDADAAEGDVLEADKDPMIVDGHSVTASNESDHDFSHRKQITRLDDVIMEAIAKLKEPRGSSRHTITEYIEGLYIAPPEFEKMLSTRLKILTENGQLIKVKHQYRIAPMSTMWNAPKELPSFLSNGAKTKDPSHVRNTGVVLLTKEQVDADLEKMKYMSPQEAAAFAAQAVAEAEAAVAAAEAALKEAEEAEADAESARCFVNAMRKSVPGNNNMGIIW